MATASWMVKSVEHTLDFLDAFTTDAPFLSLATSVAAWTSARAPFTDHEEPEPHVRCGADVATDSSPVLPRDLS
jgi:hypothetical protein